MFQGLFYWRAVYEQRNEEHDDDYRIVRKYITISYLL